MVIPGLIEMHCHILPGVDDGSKDTETSVKMLRRLALQGAETVVLTPHYYSDSISLADFTADGTRLLPTCRLLCLRTHPGCCWVQRCM